MFAASVTGMLDRFFLYFPDRELDAVPSDIALAYEDASFVTTDGVRLQGWFIPGGDVTWLWFHGNAGNIGHRLENLRQLHESLGVSVLLFDYRGFGLSEGTPSEQGIYLDTKAALDYLHSRDDVREDRIVYFGRSLGSAAAIDLALSEPPYGLILESSLPSIEFVARQAYPFLPGWFVRLIIRAQFDSLSKISSVTAPIMFLHGDRDEVVPINAGRALFEEAREPKEFYPIQGAGHNDTYRVGGEPYFAALVRFLDRLPR